MHTDIYVVKFNPQSHLRPPEPSLRPRLHAGSYAQLKEIEKIKNWENLLAKDLIAGFEPGSVKMQYSNDCNKAIALTITTTPYWIDS